MMVNTDMLVSMTEANQNFSKVAHVVDEKGMAVILKNNKPFYIELCPVVYWAWFIERDDR